MWPVTAGSPDRDPTTACQPDGGPAKSHRPVPQMGRRNNRENSARARGAPQREGRRCTLRSLESPASSASARDSRRVCGDLARGSPIRDYLVRLSTPRSSGCSAEENITAQFHFNCPSPCTTILGGNGLRPADRCPRPCLKTYAPQGLQQHESPARFLKRTGSPRR